MIPKHIQLILAAAADLLSVLTPFLLVFRKDWRLSAKKTAGILLGYLLFVCLLLLVMPLKGGPAHMNLLWSCALMAASVLLCCRLTVTEPTIVFYTLFLSQNVADSAFFLGEAIAALLLPGETNAAPFILAGAFGSSLPAAAFWLPPLILGAWGLYRLLSSCLLNAAEYTKGLPVWRLLSVIPLLFFVLVRLLCASMSLRRIPGAYVNQTVIVLCWIICVCLVHWVTLLALSNLAQSLAGQDKYSTVNQLARLQSSQLASLTASLEQLKEARHNFRHQLIVLKGLLAQGQPVQSMAFIDEYLGNGKLIQSNPYCSNLQANSLLNYYLETAKEHSVQVTANVRLPEALPLPDIDFCTILGNLLSNAVESCLRQESGRPAITVNIELTGSSMIIMSIRNTYTHQIRRKGENFLSSKRSEEGTGTASVRYLVERHHGSIKYSYGNGLFEASLLLNPNMEQRG